MSELRLAEELGRTSTLLQDAYGVLRQKEIEMDGLRAAHGEELKSLTLELEAVKAHLLLMQMLMHGNLPKAETKISNDEYTV